MELHKMIPYHIILVAFPAFGHIRPFLGIAQTIVKERSDISLTILTVGDYKSQIERELSMYFSTAEMDSRIKANIRIIKLGGEGSDDRTLMPVYSTDFPLFYDKVIKGESTTCSATQETFLLCRPNAVVVDAIRSLTGKSIPAYCFEANSVISTIPFLGPERLGGMGNKSLKARTEADATGRKYEEVLDEMYHPQTGMVIKVPGLPPMYDYELYCQELMPGDSYVQSAVIASAFRTHEQCDGVVTISSEIFERESLEAMRAWFGETNRPVYAVGPLAYPGFSNSELSDIAKQKEIDASDNGRDIMDFLDRTLKLRGRNSLIFISFGSLFWPRKNEHVWLVVDALLELNMPFILSAHHSQAVIPPGYHDKIRTSGLGLITKWCPQHAISDHPATGWMVSHCGQNSATEAMTSGTPIIAWPLCLDQAVNAQFMTLTLDVAFEMMEVRTGVGLKPLYRGVCPTGTDEAVAAEARDILKRARGPEGERKRRNVEAIRDKYKEEWGRGGDGLNELRRFLSDTC